jgi:hypothetical protein
MFIRKGGLLSMNYMAHCCESLKSYTSDRFVIAKICTELLRSSQEILKLYNTCDRSERPQINAVGNLAL